MIRLVFLGTSASLPTKDNFTSCFALKYGKTLLFDCCEGAQIQMQKYGIPFASIDAIFISHLHADHFLGIFGLLQSMGFYARASELCVFGPKGTARLFEKVLSGKELEPNFPVKFIDVAPSAKAMFETDLFAVKAFRADHGAHALGFCLEGRAYRRFDKAKCDKIGIKGRMFSDLEAGKPVEVKGRKCKYASVTYEQAGKKIVYSGDGAPSRELAKACKDADLLILDSTFADGEEALAKEKLHSTCVQAAKIAAKAKARRAVLTHFSNRYDQRAPLLSQAKKHFENCELAREGLEIIL
jgi:ribonuclease Z